MIKTVIKAQSGMVLTFDAEGEQMSEYQGCYQDVRGSILKDAPADAVFTHWINHADEPKMIARRDW
ncbi:hypothetical protein ACFLV2_02235 [Chloroflexota bacterium]